MVQSDYELTKSPLRLLLVSAALWLPLGFVVWFYMAGFLIFPTARLADWILTGWLSGAIDGIRQFHYLLEVDTLLTPEQPLPGADGRTALMVLTVNPMIYAYGMPLIFGLTMAAPLTLRRKLTQVVLGFLVLLPVQVWGVVWEVMKHFQFSMGPPGRVVIAELGLNQEVIAFAYQMGYLVLPSITPVITWVLFNRDFIQRLVGEQSSWGRGEKR